MRIRVGTRSASRGSIASSIHRWFRHSVQYGVFAGIRSSRIWPARAMGNDNRNSYHDGNHSHRLLDSGFRIIVGRKDAVMAHQKNIIVATFPEESKVYQAFSEVKQLGGKRAISIHGLAIVRRGADGRLELPDVASRGHGGSMTGGLIGSLVGILGGPIGILLG